MARGGIKYNIRNGESVPVYEIKGQLIPCKNPGAYDATVFWETRDGKKLTGYAVRIKYANTEVMAAASGLLRQLVTVRGVPLAGPVERIYLVSSVEGLKK